MFANPVFITPGIHSFSKRLTVQKKNIYISFVSLGETKEKNKRLYNYIYF